MNDYPISTDTSATGGNYPVPDVAFGLKGELPVLTNPHAARRLFDELQQAELVWRMTGKPHAEYLRNRMGRYCGQVRKEMRRIAALGPEAGGFVEMFLREFDGYAH